MWGNFLRINACTLGLFLAQAQWFSRMSYPCLRIDALLPLMFGVALKQPPLVSVLWAFAWGYVMDLFSGKFWGFHVVSYVATVCMVYLGSHKIEFYNPLYQMVFMGVCSLGQSAVLGLFLWADPASNYFVSLAEWWDLIIRSVLMLLICPGIVYLLGENRKIAF